MKHYFLIILLFACSFLNAKETTITGTIKGAENKDVRAYTYTDLITYTEKFIAKTTVDSKGHFTLKIKTDDIMTVFFKVDFCQAYIYIEPGKTYVLEFDATPLISFNETKNPFLSPVYLKYSITNADTSELNSLINRFDEMNTDFVLNNIIELMRKRNKKLVQNFKLQVDSAFKHIQHPYFTTYVAYKIAIIEESMLVESRNTLYEKYLYNKPVSAHNTGYMEFFNSYFTKFFLNISQKIKLSDLEYVINDLGSYTAFMDTLGKDSVLQNEVLREMVAIKGLTDLYSVPGFKTKNIISFLSSIAEKSKFKSHKEMARQTIKNISGFPVGSVADDFSLPDKNQQLYKLSNYNGRYVYLFFWNTACSVCLSEMDLLNNLQQKYASFLDIIGVSVDLDAQKMYRFSEGKAYKFPLLHFNYNYSIIDNYKLRNLPFFVLIDADRSIVQCPAPSPSQNIEKHLEAIKGKK